MVHSINIDKKQHQKRLVKDLKGLVPISCGLTTKATRLRMWNIANKTRKKRKIILNKENQVKFFAKKKTKERDFNYFNQ